MPHPVSSDGESPRRGLASWFATPSAAPFRWSSVALAAAAVLVLTLLSLARQPGYRPWHTVWAEDGTIFLADAVSMSFLEALLTPYNGYYQAVPRLLAEPAALLPAEWAAGYLAVVSALAVSVLALIVYVASGAYLSSTLARVVAAGIAVLIPIGQDDLPNSLCNVHWAGMYALFWLLLWTPTGRGGRTVALVTTTLMAATNICAVVFVPLAIVRAVALRDWYSRVMAGLLSAGVAAHGVGLLFGDASRETDPHVLDAFRYFFTRVLPGNLAGEVSFQPVAESHPGRIPWIIAAYLVVIGAGLLALRRVTAPNWRLALLAGGHAVAFWTVSAGATGLIATRYATTTGMLIVSGLVALLLPAARGWRAGAPLIAFTVLLSLVCAVNLRVDNRRADGPAWLDGVTAARQECSSPDVSVVQIPVTPADSEWFVRLPCSYVE